ncbi:MAG: hypothetical protein ACK5PF_07530, partial [bacterium]
AVHYFNCSKHRYLGDAHGNEDCSKRVVTAMAFSLHGEIVLSERIHHQHDENEQLPAPLIL